MASVPAQDAPRAHRAVPQPTDALRLLVRQRDLLVACGVGAMVATIYIIYAAWQWSQFAVRSWDLGIFTQALQGYASLHAPIVSIKGDGYNLLGDHFHPLLVILAPVFALFPYAFTLLVIQALCFGIAAAVITRSAIRFTSWPTGVLLGLAFGCSFGLAFAAEAQVHEVALAVPLLACSLTALIEGRWKATAIWAAPLVFVKEDLGLTVFAIGLVLAYRARSPRWLWLAAWGVAWMAIAVLIVLPALNPDGAFAYGGSSNPGGVFGDIGKLFHASKLFTITMLCVTGAGIALLSPVALVLLPTLAWRFLSTNEGYFGPTWHYSAVLMPIVFVALLDATARARSRHTGWVRLYARHAPAIAVTVALMLQPQLPLWQLRLPETWQAPARAIAAQAALAAVPSGASVESDLGLMSYLVDRHQVFWIGNDNPPADCVMIDRVSGNTPADWGDVLSVSALLAPERAYHLVYDADGYQLACADDLG